MLEDGEKGPGDSDGASKVTLGRGERVGGGGGFEEEPTDVRQSVNTMNT